MRFRARRCQHCCNVINKWGVLFGMVNCNDCAFRMASGRTPSCRVHGRAGLHHEHGQWVRH